MGGVTPVVIAWGGGVNSTAMAIGLQECGWKPDLILFADTGGEKPETYAFRETFSAWLVGHGFPPVVTVRNTGYLPILYDNCWKKRMLPSLAYGMKGCSLRYKRESQDRHVNNWGPAKECWSQGGKVIKLIGIDAGEQRRATVTEDDKYLYRYPLIEWDWDRDGCLEAIERANLKPPQKSACFFCPASTKKDVRRLAVTHPYLFKQAVALERRAIASGNLGTVKGLGRHWTWEELVASDDDSDKPETVETDCMCFDGEPEEDDQLSLFAPPGYCAPFAL